jgi:hypothetical protein
MTTIRYLVANLEFRGPCVGQLSLPFKEARTDLILAYLSHDEVNLDWGGQLANAAGALLCPLFVRDKSATSFDAVLVDLDCLPSSDLTATLEALLAGPLTCPMGEHSYSLESSEVEALQAH